MSKNNNKKKNQLTKPMEENNISTISESSESKSITHEISRKIIETLITHDAELPLDNYVLDKSWILVCPNRWATLTSLILDGVEIFYSDSDRRNDPTKNVREWFWMWPQAWPFSLEQNAKYWYNLKQHWFLRDSSWEKKWIDGDVISYNLQDNPDTIKQFPHSFFVSQKLELWDKWVRISLEVENKWKNNMKFAPWHHTYYKVSPEDKLNIKLSENMWIDDVMKSKWALWEETIKILNPWSCQIFIPWVGLLLLTFDSKFKYLRLWSEKGKWFVCIEPVVCHPSEWDNSSIVIKPEEILNLWFTITLLSKDI